MFAATAREAERADAEARAEREVAAQRDRAVAAERHARTEADTATAVQRFLQFDLLQAANPYLRPEADPDLKVRDVLRRTAGAVAGRFHDQPLVEAAVRTTLGNSLNAVGDPGQAAPHLERAHHGPSHPDTLAAMNNFSVAYWHVAPPQKAIAHAEHAFELHRAAAGADAASTLDAEMILGVMYLQKGQPDKAVGVLEDCRQRRLRLSGPDDERTLRTTIHIASALWLSGELARAATLLEDCRARSGATYGADHLLTLLVTNILAHVYLVQDRRLPRPGLGVHGQRGAGQGRRPGSEIRGRLARPPAAPGR